MLEEYEFIDEEGYPIAEKYHGTRIPKPKKEPNYIRPFPGCFGSGPVKLGTRTGRLVLKTNSFETWARTYEITVVVEKDHRRGMAKLEIEIGEVPGPIFTISCISESLCFPGSDAVYVNPTSRLALVGKCTQWCEDGELTYEWSLMSSEFDINTVSSAFHQLYNSLNILLTKLLTQNYCEAPQGYKPSSGTQGSNNENIHVYTTEAVSITSTTTTSTTTTTTTTSTTIATNTTTEAPSNIKPQRKSLAFSIVFANFFF